MQIIQVIDFGIVGPRAGRAWFSRYIVVRYTCCEWITERTLIGWMSSPATIGTIVNGIDTATFFWRGCKYQIVGVSISGSMNLHGAIADKFGLVASIVSTKWIILINTWAGICPGRIIQGWKIIAASKLRFNL